MYFLIGKKNMTHLPEVDDSPHFTPIATPQGKSKKDFVKRNIEVCQCFTEGRGSSAWVHHVTRYTFLLLFVFPSVVVEIYMYVSYVTVMCSSER